MILSSIITGQGGHPPGGGGTPEPSPPSPHGQGSCEKTSLQKNTSKTVNKNLFETFFIVFKNRETIFIKK
jgi:hypothetical protein